MEEGRLKIVIDGKEYKTLDEVPEKYRSLIEKQVQAASTAAAAAADQSGAATFKIKKEFKISIHRKESVPRPDGPQAPEEFPGIEPSSSSRQSVVLLLLAAAAILAYFLLKPRR